MAGKQDIKAGSAYVELALKGGAALRKGLTAAVGQLKSMATAAATAGAVMGAATVGVFAAATKQFLETGDALDKMRQRTGLSVEAISKLDHAAGQSGASLEDVENGVRKMQRELGKAGPMSAEMADALKALGLRLEDLQKLSPEEQFNTLSAAIGGIEDPTKRSAAAMQFFGKSGTKLLPMIEDLDALKQEAEDMGFVMSGRAASASVVLGDKLANLWKTIKFASLALGEALTPALDSAATHIQKFATKALKIVQLMAVDWKLGGQIAVKGLQLAILNGLASLSLDDFAGKMLGGDLAGSFSVSLGVLTDLWAGFAEGLIAVFTQAMRGVTSVWEKATHAISDWILENPIIAKLALIGTGIDLAAELERAKKLDAQRGVASDPLGDTQRMAREQLTGQADGVRGRLDQMDRNAQARTRDAANALRERTQKAQAEFDALLAKAAQLRMEGEHKDAVRQQEALAGAGEMAEQAAIGNGPQSQVSGTFSASAAAAMGQSGSEMVRLSRAQVKALELLARLTERNQQEQRQLAAIR